MNMLTKGEGTLSDGFGQWVREHRRQRNMNQVTLARAANLSPSFISSLENGKRLPPSFDKAQLICEALGSSLWQALRDVTGELAQPDRVQTCTNEAANYEQFLEQLRKQIDSVLPPGPRDSVNLDKKAGQDSL
ncbi:MAG: multiprotein-bridging factor 1 family protein [Porticoccaceae bacterium]